MKVFVCPFHEEVMVVARNESFEVKNIEAVNPGICRTYATHLGLIGVGVKVLNPGKEGGCPCLSHHGS